MKCYECKWLDRSVILTSYPPQYRCTLGFGSHYADHECGYDFMPIVRCKDCKHWHSNTEFCGIWSFQNIAQRTLSDDYCSRSERREE
jgi:hypothetical protein